MKPTIRVKPLTEVLRDIDRIEEEERQDASRESVKSSVKLTRKDDRGEMIELEMTLKTGMPDMLIVEQRGNSTYNRVDMTMREAKIFRYALAEMERFLQLARKEDDDDEY